jgi:methylphosphotriester-DNA--protein-cysteine methyltransferase
MTCSPFGSGMTACPAGRVRRPPVLAAVRLRDTDDTVGAIARSLGYTSEYAFNRAFTRDRRISPGRYRARSRAIRPHDPADAAEGNPS